MRRVFFADLETTGLNCLENQSVELAIVEFRGGVIDYGGGFHCYIDHKNLNFNVDALLKTAYCHIELKEVDKGKKELEQLIVKYPNHPVAEMARGRLRGLNLGQ